MRKEHRYSSLQHKIKESMDDAGVRGDFGWTSEEIANEIKYDKTLVSLKRTLHNMWKKGVIQRKKCLGLVNCFGETVKWCYVYILNKHLPTYLELERESDMKEDPLVRDALAFITHGWSGRDHTRTALLKVVNEDPSAFISVCEYMSQLFEENQ